MEKLKGLFSKINRRRLFAVMLVALVCVGAIALVNVYNAYLGYKAAQDEYNDLRNIKPIVIAPTGNADTAFETDIDLREINPSYVCWLRIEDTQIDYPVVQGQDNEYYMYRTFKGERNSAGTPFMDIMCPGGLDAPLSIIYGHNMHDGSMFAALHKYRNSSYFFDHPDITIVPYEEDPLTYRVFAVLLTDVYDKIFELRGQEYPEIFNYCSEIGKPDGSGKVLVLSTCTTGGSDDDRLLVFAAQI